VYKKWRVFVSRLSAQWRKVVAGDVLLVVALIAHIQGWNFVYSVAFYAWVFLLTLVLLNAAWPSDPDGVKKLPSRRW